MVRPARAEPSWAASCITTAMPIEAHRAPVWLLPLLASALVAGVLPSSAGAKFTCEQRGVQGMGVAVRGLPASRIAGRSYRIVVPLPTSTGVTPRPYLGAQHCERAGGREPAPAIDGRFRRVGGQGSRVFALNLRFPRPGPWALSLMDLDGSFYDLGLRQVRWSATGARITPATAQASGSPAATWILAGGGLVVAAG